MAQDPKSRSMRSASALGIVAILLGAFLLLRHTTPKLWALLASTFWSLSRYMWPLCLIIAALMIIFMRKSSQSVPGDQSAFRRSSKDYYIAGVCGGIAEHFGLDRGLVRLLAVLSALFSSGLSILLYILLWVCLPRR